MRLSESFKKFFENECVPTKPDEKVRPTRVLYKKHGTVTTKLFPTQERAASFVAEILVGEHGKCEYIGMQDATEPPTARNDRYTAKYQAIHKYGRHLKGWRGG